MCVCVRVCISLYIYRYIERVISEYVPLFSSGSDLLTIVIFATCLEHFILYCGKSLETFRKPSEFS